MIFALVPLVTLIRQVQRFNFLQIGRQRNLIYAVFMVVSCVAVSELCSPR